MTAPPLYSSLPRFAERCWCCGGAALTAGGMGACQTWAMDSQVWFGFSFLILTIVQFRKMQFLWLNMNDRIKSKNPNKRPVKTFSIADCGLLKLTYDRFFGGFERCNGRIVGVKVGECEI
jgi:hypothetical protein